MRSGWNISGRKPANNLYGNIFKRRITTVRTPVAIVGGGPTGLMLSILLSQYNIASTLFDAKNEEDLYLHPQAHYLNLRTMEILRHCVPFVYEKVVREAPDRKYWQAFNFSHSVMGRQIARIIHPVEGIKTNQKGNGILIESLNESINSSSHDDSTMNPSFSSRCSECDPLHLAQNKFTKILLEEARRMSHLVTSGLVNISYGEPVISVEENSNTSSMKLYTANREIEAQFIIAADGANSTIRKHHNGTMIGDLNMQNLINVHFKTSERLSKLLMQEEDKVAMLHFVFNTKLVGVFVCHDLENGEWVLQIPFFPPFQHHEEFSQQRVRDMLLSGLFNSCHIFHDITSSDISILSIKPWSMSASVAKSYILGNKKSIILAGDAAHTFPPAGGFGMNTGIQDVHNLAWRLASKIKNGDKDNNSLFFKYEEERRHIASQNAALSVRNYSRTLKIVKALNLDPNYPSMLKSMLLSPPMKILSMSSRSKIFNDLTNVAIMSLSTLEHAGNIYGDALVKSVRRILKSGGGLPLLFPRFELGFAYRTSNALNDEDDTSAFVPRILSGFRMPHIEVMKTSEKQIALSTTDLGDQLLQRWLHPKPPSKCIIIFHFRKYDRSLILKQVHSWANQMSDGLEINYVEVYSQNNIDDIEPNFSSLDQTFVDRHGTFENLLLKELREADIGHSVAISLRPDGHIDYVKVFKNN